MKTVIFHVISHFDMGGAERVAINIAKSESLDFEYHVVEVVKTKGEFRDNLIRECRNCGIIVHTSLVNQTKLAIFFFNLWFVGIVVKYRPDIIHTHTEVPDTAVFLWHSFFGKIFPKIKYIRTIHNTRLWTHWNLIGRNIEKFFKKSQANIAISCPTQKNYLEVYGESPCIIYNGVEEIRQEIFPQIVSDKINVLFAGRLEYQKGVDVLIAVIKALSDDDRFFFHIVGEGSMLDELNIAIATLSCCKRYSKIYQLSTYIGSFDYVFMPSYFEGLAILPIEASLARVPTIINRCDGLKECLPDVWSLAVENNDIDDFLNIFHSLPNVDRKILGEKAYEYASTHFSISKMQMAYEEKYSQVLAFDE